jgi:Tfp pilus assembly protein PilF
MRLHGRPDARIDAAARRDLERGVSRLRAVTAYAPGNWSAHWMIGKAYQALGDAPAAYDAFRTACDIQPGHADVAREFTVACLETGRADEAVRAAERAVSLTPSDAGLHANLALAYLTARRPADATRAVDEALRLDPSDAITQHVKTMIAAKWGGSTM